MNELEKCMNFYKNLDFALPTSIGGFRGPGERCLVFTARAQNCMAYSHPLGPSAQLFIDITVARNIISQRIDFAMGCRGCLVIFVSGDFGDLLLQIYTAKSVGDQQLT
jgi:hypothetical protein